MHRKRGLLLTKVDSEKTGQLLKYPVLHYLSEEVGCGFGKARYIIATYEFLERHYADIAQNRPAIFQDIVANMEGRMLFAAEVVLPEGMTCEEFRDTVVGPTFVAYEAIEEKAINKAKKELKKQMLANDPELANDEERLNAGVEKMLLANLHNIKADVMKDYLAARETLRGKFINLNEGVEHTKTFNVMHYSASADEAKDELNRVFKEDFPGKLATRILNAKEIKALLDATKDCCLTTREQVEDLRRGYLDFVETRKLMGIAMPAYMLEEQYTRSLTNKEFARFNFVGDNFFQEYIAQMENLYFQQAYYDRNRKVEDTTDDAQR